MLLQPAVKALISPKPGREWAQLVVTARDRLWAIWHRHDHLGDGSALALHSLVQGWWNHLSGWFLVDPEPCASCSHFWPLCSVCGALASRFLSEDRVVMLCGSCGDALEGRAGLPEQGTYLCCDGCSCDEGRSLSPGPKQSREGAVLPGRGSPRPPDAAGAGCLNAALGA